jgi:hypothetical protein
MLYIRPAIMDTMGWIYYKEDLFEWARNELTESAKKLPDNVYNLRAWHPSPSAMFTHGSASMLPADNRK